MDSELQTELSYAQLMDGLVDHKITTENGQEIFVDFESEMIVKVDGVVVPFEKLAFIFKEQPLDFFSDLEKAS